MAEQNPKPTRRCQSVLVFTTSNGRTVSSCNGDSPKRSVKKTRVLSPRVLSRQQQQQLPPPLTPQPQPSQPQTDAALSSWQSRRVSAPPNELHNPPFLPTFDSSAILSHLQSPARCATPSKIPRSLNFAAEGFLLQTSQQTSQLPPDRLLPCTPSASQKKCPLPPSAKKIKLRAAMKLKALENERLEASRYEQDRTDLVREAQEKAYSAWLNRVLLEPMNAKHSASESESEAGSVVSNESCRFSSFSDLSHLSESILTVGDRAPGSELSASPRDKKTPRAEKRNKHSKASGKREKDGLPIDASFQAICSIPVLRSRLDPFLDPKIREDVISTMINIAKHIDDGRLRMKDGCTILNDVALKEKLIQAMLNYNTPWLKIGLHVVLGHTALLVQETLESMSEDSNQWDSNKETQHALLRLIIEKHFLSHAGLAKYHATNKKIEGLYKPGYYEALARVILKRLLLLVLTLDKAKGQSTIPLACGIDGLDGGSPLLFRKDGNVKSSRHALQEFLLHAMHGEGDIIGHLGVLGYHVTHIQAGLADYSFEVTNVIEDLKDGVRLCRLVQVLLGDTSILKKVKVPADHIRRRKHNCGVALERLARAGVSIVDAFGCPIMADDLVEGDQERVFTFLWNIMVSLQIPALVNAQKLCQEIARIQAFDLDPNTGSNDLSLVDLLLLWAQVICVKVGFLVKNFTSSFADGQVLCHLISYYYPKVLPRRAIQSLTPPSYPVSSVISGHTPALCGNTAQIKGLAAHNLSLFQLSIHKLGSIPEVLQPSHFLHEDPFVCEQSIAIMLVFLYHRMVEAALKVEEKMAALSWDADLDSYLREGNVLEAGSRIEEELMGTADMVVDMKQWMFNNAIQQQESCRQRAARVIQAAVRRWLTLKKCASKNNFALYTVAIDALQAQELYLSQKQACLQIQRSWRMFLAQKSTQPKHDQLVFSAIKIQSWWRKLHMRRISCKKRAAAVLIQSHFRSFLERKQFIILKKGVLKLQALAKGRYVRRWYWNYKDSVIKIQGRWRGVLAVRSCRKKHAEAATKIQSHWHKLCAMRSFSRNKNAITFLQRHWRGVLAARACVKKQVEAVIKIQCYWQKYMTRRSFVTKRNTAILLQRQWRKVMAARLSRKKQVEAVATLQANWRKFCTQRSYARKRKSVILLQSYVRNYLARKKYMEYKKNVVKVQALVRGRHQRKNYCVLLESVRRIQCWWRGVLARRDLEKQYARRKAAAIFLQSCVRCSFERKQFLKCKRNMVRLQAVVRGRCQRKRYCMLLDRTKTIQCCWRRVLARRDLEKQNARRIVAVTKVQAFWRGFSTRRSFLMLKARTNYVQNWVRTFLCRKRYNRLTETVVKMQALVRSKQARIRYRNIRESVVKIQAIFRGRKQHREYKLCVERITKLQAHREHQHFLKYKNAALIIQRHSRKWLHLKRLLKARQLLSAMTIQYAWKKMCLQKAATLIQAYFRGWIQRRYYLTQIIWMEGRVQGGLVHQQLLREAVGNKSRDAYIPLHHDSLGITSIPCSQEKDFCLQQYALKLQGWWRNVLSHRNLAATMIQKHFRGFQERKAYSKKRTNIINIQAVWRGFLVRYKNGHAKEELFALRKRMQSTAANVDKKMRLEYRLMEALAALLSQKTVSSILHTCATIDLATQHSKLCCERLLEAGAIPKLLQLIRTTNRSTPHEEILKHSLSILGNLARYPPFATLVANAPDSLNIVADQILRNNEEVLSKVIKLLQLVCKIPSGLDAVRKNYILMKRLRNISQVLERKAESEARALARHSQTAPLVARRLGEKKVGEAVAQHYAVVVLLQAITGEDLQARLKAVKRLSSIYMVPAVSRISISRFPLQDCSNH